MNVFNHLFDTSAFMPRSRCGTGWDSFTILADTIANGFIFAAHIAIPLGLLLMRTRLRRLTMFGEAPRWVFASFIVFMLLCGFTYFWDIVVFSYPVHRFFVLWNWLTAVSAWVGVYGIFVIVRRLQEMHPQSEVDALVGERDQAMKDKVEAQTHLKSEIDRKVRQQERLRDEISGLRDIAVRLEHDEHLKGIAAEIRQKLLDLRTAAQ